MDLLTSHRHSICSNCHRLSATLGFSGFVSVCYSAGKFALPRSLQQAAGKVLLSASLPQEKTDSKITLLYAILSLPSRVSSDEARGAPCVICRAAGKQDALQILSQQVLGELIRLFRTASQGCPGEPTALQTPCASIGQPAHTQFGLILQLNELKALTHSSEAEDQQQNSNQRRRRHSRHHSSQWCSEDC